MNDQDFSATINRDGFTLKLWRGERMCLIGFDVDQPEPDFVGFAVECWTPGDPDYHPLRNRLAFSYPAMANETDSLENIANVVTGDFSFPSTEAPFQRFRWVHFPHAALPGMYKYRATKMHMPSDGNLVRGTSLELEISLDQVTYPDFLDVGFTRNFASSQAFVDKVGGPDKLRQAVARLLPGKADQGLEFHKQSGDLYKWLGFEAHELLFKVLEEAGRDSSISLDVFAYDLNEPDIVSGLEAIGDRLRVIIDDSPKEHNQDSSAESQAAERLRASAGEARVKRLHFKHLQHHKVIIVKRNGHPERVLAGSTNFSFRGLYIQANNLLKFTSTDLADLFEQVFEAAFTDSHGFHSSELASKWHVVQTQGKPTIEVCFSPHVSSDLSLEPLAQSINQAQTSVFYAVAFLNQMKSGPTFEAFGNLIKRPIFSYGLSDKLGGLEVYKPDGSVGLATFAALAEHAPPPFQAEFSGGSGVNLHHKFVVIDFNTPNARVFTGSSNLAPSGEEGNGDHLIMIQDQRVATSYAIEAIRVFDHVQFRARRSDALKNKDQTVTASSDRLGLLKPTAISGKPAWFEKYYVDGSQKQRDRQLFAS